MDIGEWTVGMAHLLGLSTVHCPLSTVAACSYTLAVMHYDAHQPVIDDLEARILTIRDSL